MPTSYWMYLLSTVSFNFKGSDRPAYQKLLRKLKPGDLLMARYVSENRIATVNKNGKSTMKAPVPRPSV